MGDLRQNTVSLTLLNSLLMLAGCNQSGPEATFDRVAIYKVTVGISGNGCESACPFQAVSIDNKQKLWYYGGPYAAKKGYFEGNVTKATWDSIQSRFAKVYTAGVDTLKWERTDFPEVELSIESNEGIHKFRKNLGKVSDSDEHTLAWFVDAIPKEIKLSARDSLKFDTRVQYENVPEAEK
jgi:hypothetical protein